MGDSDGVRSVSGAGTGGLPAAGESGFAAWAVAAASELAYFGDLDLEAIAGLEEAGDARAAGDTEDAGAAVAGGGVAGPGYAFNAAVRFLLSGEVLGDPDGRGMPGYYAARGGGPNRCVAAEGLLYCLYGGAWRDLDGQDCDLRLYTECDPEEDLGTVIALDATGRAGSPAGTVIFLLDSLDLGRLVCRTGAELHELYAAVSRGSRGVSPHPAAP